MPRTLGRTEVIVKPHKKNNSINVLPK